MYRIFSLPIRYIYTFLPDIQKDIHGIVVEQCERVSLNIYNTVDVINFHFETACFRSRIAVTFGVSPCVTRVCHEYVNT